MNNNNNHKNHFYWYTKNGHRYLHLPDNWTDKIVNSNKAYWLMVLIVTLLFLAFIFVIHILAIHGIYIYRHGRSLGDPANLNTHPVTTWSIISFVLGWVITQGTRMENKKKYPQPTSSNSKHKSSTHFSLGNLASDAYYDVFIAPFIWLGCIFVLEMESNGDSLAKNIGLGIFSTNVRMVIYAIFSIIIGMIIGAIINFCKKRMH